MRAESAWFSLARDKGRVLECGDDEGDELRRASGTPEVILKGGVLIVSQLLGLSEIVS